MLEIFGIIVSGIIGFTGGYFFRWSIENREDEDKGEEV